MLQFLRKKKRIGFIVENALPYHQAMASTRLRCYDVINYLNKNSYQAEVYRCNHQYDVVIFQKCFRQKHYELANKIKQQGISVVLDININIVEEYGDVSAIFNGDQLESIKRQRSDLKKFLQITDHVLVSSLVLLESYRKYHTSVFCIEEIVTDNFFRKRKLHQAKNLVTLLYVGYAIKAVELEIIREVLNELYNKYQVEILFVSDQPPDINVGNVPTQFRCYNQKILSDLLLQSDIKLAPRDLKNQYNVGHSFTKVAYPMAVGLPVVASPVPSYLNREVIVCREAEDWYVRLEELIKDHNLRNYYGARGSSFVKNNFAPEAIGKQYSSLLNLLAKQ